MRPLAREAKPTYRIPPEMTTKKAIVLAGLKEYKIKPVPGTTDTFKTEEVLKLLLNLTAENKGVPRWGGLHADVRQFITELIDYFTNNDTMKYGNARGALITNFGEYCGYCGMPVLDSMLEIEHCLPKSVFPSLMLTYENFFLACHTCNGNKGQNPTYLISAQWADKHIKKNPNIQEIILGGIQRQMWPTSGLYAWAGFPPYLLNIANKTPINSTQSLDLNNTLVDVTENIVTARILGYVNPVKIAACMATHFTSTQQQEQEDNFMAYIKLNEFKANDYSDRRVTNRTVTWLKVLFALKRLEIAKEGTPEWEVILEIIFLTARTAGFFEIWSWIFWEISPPGKSKPALVYQRFRDDSTDKKKPALYFPGTNKGDLPAK